MAERRRGRQRHGTTGNGKATAAHFTAPHGDAVAKLGEAKAWQLAAMWSNGRAA